MTLNKTFKTEDTLSNFGGGQYSTITQTYGDETPKIHRKKVKS